jgi:signal transduction histidine kinase
MNQFLRWWNIHSAYGTENRAPGIARRVMLANQVGLTVAMVSFFFTLLWTLRGNGWMVLTNLLVGLIHLITPWLNLQGWINFSRYSILFWLPTFLFIFVGMTGEESEIHTCFYTITAFACILFDPKEKIKLILAVLYPMSLFGILVYNDFSILPNVLGYHQHEGSAAINYFLNFLLVSLSMFFLYRASEKTEGQYKELYEQHVLSQKLLDEERARAIYSMRMAALGEMAGGIAHEINSPLNVITILSEQLQKRIPSKQVSEAQVLESIAKINTTANRIGDIVSSLRSISRTGTGLPIKEAEIKNILHETLVLCRERFRTKDIHLQFEMPQDLPPIKCRSIEISQVLLNILNNACDAVEGVNNPTIEITVWTDKDHLSVGVSDNGHGITLENREKIFSPFFTTKEVGKGTGLGLSLSKGLVEANHGRLYLNPLMEKTQFVIELNLSTDV